jgi:hypothetical protein
MFLPGATPPAPGWEPVVLGVLLGGPGHQGLAGLGNHSRGVGAEAIGVQVRRYTPAGNSCLSGADGEIEDAAA